MTEPPTCSECGAPLPAQAPDSCCPRCGPRPEAGRHPGLSRRHLLRYVLPAAVVLAGVALRKPLTIWLEQTPPFRGRRRRRAWQRAEPILAWAETTSTGAIPARLAPLAEFFAHAKAGTGRFAEEVLGWGGKWRVVADKLPGTDGDRLKRFVREQFEAHVFSSAQLTAELQHVAAAFLAGEREIENETLVKLRADVGEVAGFASGAFADDAALQRGYARTVDALWKSSATRLDGELTEEAISAAAGEILTLVAARMAVSGGILAAGASSGWATFGLGLIVGVLVDYVVSWAWDKYADPKGALARELGDRIGQIAALLVSGDARAPGLTARLTQLSRERAQLRREAIRALIENQTEQP